MSAALYAHFAEPETIDPSRLTTKAPTEGVPLVVAAVERRNGGTAQSVARDAHMSPAYAGLLLRTARRAGLVTRTRYRNAYAYLPVP